MIEVYLEVGTKKTFAMTRGWPGWGRAAKTPDAAVEALSEYHGRYSVITASVGVELPKTAFDVIAEIDGNATTDFGAPGGIPGFDHELVPPETIHRQVHLLQAGLDTFLTRAASAPEVLRKGPRGGGRDTSKIVQHVADADRGYATTIGVKAGKRPIEEIRAEIVTRCLHLAEEPGHTKWPLPYYLRRAAWHITDHLWEIEDKS